MSGELANLVDRHGDAFAVDPARIRGSLLDALGDMEPEVSLLVSAAEADVTNDLIDARGAVTPRLFSDLTQRLIEERGLTPRGARWVVDTWAWALAVGEPEPALTPVATPDPTVVDDVTQYTLTERPPFRLADHVFSVAVVAFVVATVATLVVLSRSGPTAPAAAEGRARPQVVNVVIPVPAVKSLSRAEAVDRLVSLGLEPEITSAESDEFAPGTVLTQDPAPGASVRDGSPVTLVVAAAPVDVGRPVDLTFAKSQTTVTITWVRPADGSDVREYEIWRDGELIGTRRADKRTFTDGGLVPGARYRYSVKAIGENGTEARSRTRSIRLLRPAPTPDPVAPEAPVVEAPAPPPEPPPPPPEPCDAPDPDFCN